MRLYLFGMGYMVAHTKHQTFLNIQRHPEGRNYGTAQHGTASSRGGLLPDVGIFLGAEYHFRCFPDKKIATASNEASQ